MADYFTTKQKIELANSVIAELCGEQTLLGYQHPIFIKIRKMEEKYIASDGRYCDLSDFSISLSELPQKHFRLMLVIGWLDHEEEQPKPYIAGFYKSKYPGRRGFTKIEHFMTIDAYIRLLLIEMEIDEMYVKNKAG